MWKKLRNMRMKTNSLDVTNDAMLYYTVIMENFGDSHNFSFGRIYINKTDLMFLYGDGRFKGVYQSGIYIAPRPKHNIEDLAIALSDSEESLRMLIEPVQEQMKENPLKHFYKTVYAEFLELGENDK